ncbi:MAG TPA: asparagine synthase-related protein [Solirubrobacterales bacterium]|nr:asparagine synthase-related protein [Solirubrobacterales bacterium]
MSTEGGTAGGTGRGAAFAGVFDPRRSAAGDGLRARLAAALEPDGEARRWDDGCLSLAWTEGVACAEPSGEGEGVLSLLDGSLYNRSELAAGLGLPEGIGAAELLASGYAQLGAELLPRLRGDFALLLWDPARRSGLIARDQLGGRSLFLHRLGEGIAFASEVRNLTRLLPRRPAPDPDAVARWFVPALTREGRTLFEGVEALGPATRLTLGDGAPQASRYWTPRYRRPRAASPEEAGAQVRAALRQAVNRRLGPDDSTAVLLSGGIDSGSVAGVAAAERDGGAPAPRSYSVVLPGYPELDEGPLIDSIATGLGLRATALQLRSGGLLSGALPFIESWEVPPITTTLFFLHPLLRRAAGDGVDVLLDGEGGDALFWHAPGLVGERLRRGHLLSAWSLAGRFPEYGSATTWRTRLHRLRALARPRGTVPSPPAWLSADRLVGGGASRVPPWEGPAWWTAHVDGVLGLGSQLMHDLSRRHAALSGIEPRHPLLDVDLIELALSLPPELAFDRRYNRPVLRHAVEGLLSDGPRLRPYKSHFDPVLIDGLRADLPVLERLLLAPGAEVGAYVDRRRLEEHFASPPGGADALREWSKQIWFLATIECWLRQQGGCEPVPKELMKNLQKPSFSFAEL